jgi:hypothetical protein
MLSVLLEPVENEAGDWVTEGLFNPQHHIKNKKK